MVAFILIDSFGILCCMITVVVHTRATILIARTVRVVHRGRYGTTCPCMVCIATVAVIIGGIVMVAIAVVCRARHVRLRIHV